MSEAVQAAGRSRRPVSWVAGVVALVGVAGVIGWFATRGDELATLRGHTGPVRALAIDSELGYLVSGGDDGTARVWDVRTNRLVSTSQSVNGKLTGLAVRSPHLWAVGAGPKVHMWTIPSLLPSDPFDLPADAESVAASADGKHVAVGESDGHAWLQTRRADPSPKAIKLHAKSVHCLTFTPDGSRLVSGSSDGSVRVFDVAARKAMAQLAVGKRKVHGLVISPDGTRLYAAVAGMGLRAWTLDRREELPAFGEDAGMAWCVAVSPDGNKLASGHEDGSVKVWEANPPKVLKTYRGHRSVALAVVFAADGASVFSASGDGTIKRWKVPGR